MTQMTQRIIIASFLLASPSLGQQQQLYDERLVRELADHYGISTLVAPLGANEPRIASLEPVHSYLEGRFGTHGRRKSETNGIREVHKPYVLVLREDGKTQTFNGGWIDIWLTGSASDVGKAAAVYMSRLAVRFQKDSFSGSPLGDWAAHYSEDPCILFFRRNALVRVACNRAVEITKADKSKRSVADPDALGTCEDLARDIDAELVKLPVAEKGAK